MKIGETLDVRDRRSWRAWLARNHRRKSEVWLIYYRKGSGKPRISYNDAVEEALCYGWIDSTVKALDEERFAQRFSVRRKTSTLSQMNKERVRKLIAANKMTGAGLAAIEHVFDPATDRPEPLKVPTDILTALKQNRRAWANFKRLPEAYKRIRIAYIESRKRHGVGPYRRSLEHFVEMTAKNKRIGLVKEMR